MFEKPMNWDRLRLKRSQEWHATCSIILDTYDTVTQNLKSRKDRMVYRSLVLGAKSRLQRIVILCLKELLDLASSNSNITSVKDWQH